MGKTFLACNVISKFYRQHEIVGLKITDHKHSDTANAATVYQHGQTILLEEKDPESTKDTARMLAAGANRSFLLQTNEDELENALTVLFSMIGQKSMIVCESGMVSRMIPKGILLFVRQLSCRVCTVEKKIPRSGNYRIITFTGKGFDIDLNNLSIENNTWKLKE